MKKIRTDVVALVQMGMLAAIAVVLVMLIHFPIIPAVSFIEYDMADVPVLIGTLLYGRSPACSSCWWLPWCRPLSWASTAGWAS